MNNRSMNKLIIGASIALIFLIIAFIPFAIHVLVNFLGNSPEIIADFVNRYEEARQ